jgi:L-ascorbate metabolism protein UlaG (beta-lactamase superfamily)
MKVPAYLMAIMIPLVASSAFVRYQSLMLRPARLQQNQAAQVGSVARPVPVEQPAPPVEVTWLGNAGVYISDRETGFMIDPFVSRYNMLRVGLALPMKPRRDLISDWMKKLRAKDVQAVLVSHSHYDHSMDAPFFAIETGAPLVGTESTANVGRGAGLYESQIRVVKGGDTMQIGKFKITFVSSEHGPALFGRVPFPGLITEPLKPPAAARKYKMGGVFGIVIEHPSGTIVHHGSAGYSDGMYDGIKADVVMLGLAGRAGSF